MAAAASAGPLAGLKVIELGSTVAGPFCGRLLADFGADVVKIEQPEGDALRTFGERIDGRSLYATSIFRSKRNCSINLRTDAGRDLVRRMCLNADIVVENFRPGTLEKWGLGYDALAKENPGLIMVRISGFGQTGPYSQRAGYGVTSEAVSGLRGITGDPDRPPPRMATSLSDYITGLYAAFGTAMAVVDRNRTGRGQIIDAALYEGAFSFMEPHVPAFQQLELVAERAGSRLPGNAPNTLFETRDGGYIHIAASSDAVFKRFAEVIGHPELPRDPRFATAVKRAENIDAIEEAVAAWARTVDLTEAERLMAEANVPASRIYSIKDLFEDPQVKARKMIVEVEDTQFGETAIAGIVPKLSRTPGAVRWAGRDRGTDTRAVLKDELALDDAAIDTLVANGVVVEKR